MFRNYNYLYFDSEEMGHAEGIAGFYGVYSVYNVNLEISKLEVPSKFNNYASCGDDQ